MHKAAEDQFHAYVVMNQDGNPNANGADEYLPARGYSLLPNGVTKLFAESLKSPQDNKEGNESLIVSPKMKTRTFSQTHDANTDAMIDREVEESGEEEEVDKWKESFSAHDQTRVKVTAK